MKKIMVVEDTVLKFCDISRALEQLYPGVKIDHQECLADAWQALDGMREEDSLPDLIITDMRYPREAYGQELPEAGYELLAYVNEQELNIPVVICSSGRFPAREKGLLGAVQYSERRDLLSDLRELLKG